MAQPKATFTVRHIESGISAIEVQGEVTSLAEKALMDAYTQAGMSGATTIVLNFSRMDYMNSSGIGLLVTLLVRVNRQKQRLLAVGLNDHYRRIFELTRLDEAIPVYATEAEVVASAQPLPPLATSPAPSPAPAT